MDEEREKHLIKRREACRLWRLRNPGYQKQWQKENPERMKGYCRKYLAKNRDKVIARQRNWLANNREFHNTRSKEWRLKNPRRDAAILRRYKYGIEPEQYDALFTAQGGICAICKERPVRDIDHCHKTGKVRGLLCHSCNAGLGFFRDTPEFLLRAADYLKHYES